MQAGIIIRVFVASPSDVQTERDEVLAVVTRWNAANSFRRKMIVEAVRVETHAESQVVGPAFGVDCRRSTPKAEKATHG